MLRHKNQQHQQQANIAAQNQQHQHAAADAERLRVDNQTAAEMSLQNDYKLKSIKERM